MTTNGEISRMEKGVKGFISICLHGPTQHMKKSLLLWPLFGSGFNEGTKFIVLRLTFPNLLVFLGGGGFVSSASLIKVVELGMAGDSFNPIVCF